MASHHPSDFDSSTADSTTSSPRSDYPPLPPHRSRDDLQPPVRFMCSFGGRIIPRPHDNELRYVGGDTRIVAVQRFTSFSSLVTKLSKLSGISEISVKYQLPNEDLDALISVTTDEDVENMMEEYDRFTHGVNSKLARLRLFLFPAETGFISGGLGSVLNCSSKRENWFFDALNGSSGRDLGSLECGQSEASSIVSEVPDYLFGLDNSDEHRDPKPKNQQIGSENLSISDPGSPIPASSSPPVMPNLPPVKTRIENYPVVESREGFVESGGYSGNPMWHVLRESHFHGRSMMQPMPVYYVTGPIPASNVQVQVQPGPMLAQYVQAFNQPPVGFRYPVTSVSQVYGGAMNQVTVDGAYESDGQVYYAPRNLGMLPAYPSNTVPTRTPEFQEIGQETKTGNG